MSAARPYEAYSETGVDWIERIPESWMMTRLKLLVEEDRQITYGIVQAGPNFEGGIPYIRPADMSDEGGVNEFGGLLRTSPEIASSYSRSAINSGDLVCSIGPSFGKVMLVPDELSGGNLTQGTARVAISAANSARFYFWALRSPGAFQQWESGVGGATFRALNLRPLAETQLPRPPVEEQTQIAKFLDYETAKIDALIEKQQQLIALLKEKRQAVISHAVTKGLNPDAPMRDSGVEWLGEVPAHWRVMRFGLTNVRAELGGNYLAGEGEDGINVIKMGNIDRGKIRLEKVERLPASDSYAAAHLLRCGDFLFNTRNSIDLVGKVAVWRSEIEAAVYNSNILRIEFSKIFIGPTRFVSYLFNSTLAIGLLRLFAKGTTSVAAIYYKDLRQIIFAFPPCDEQSVISDELDRKCMKVDAAIERAESMSHLLQERRTALVSAAVTGKIDVRDWIQPDA